MLRRLIRGCPMLTDICSAVYSDVMDYVVKDSPQFRPTRLILESDCNWRRRHVHRVKEYQEIAWNQIPMLRVSIEHSLLFEDPFLYSILETVGTGIDDLSIVGTSPITERCFIHLPNISALRMYQTHMFWELNVPNSYCCKHLVTLECIGPAVFSENVVSALVRCRRSALRAVAIFNTELYGEHIQSIDDLGTKFRLTLKTCSKFTPNQHKVVTRAKRSNRLHVNWAVA